MLCTSRIQITYGTTPGPEHGGGGGSESFFILEPNEYIVEIEGRAADRLDYAPLTRVCLRVNLLNIKLGKGYFINSQIMSLLILFSD